MKSKEVNKKRRFVTRISIILVGVVFSSIGLGFGFNEANSRWHLKAYTKKINLAEMKYNQDELLIMSYNIRCKSIDVFGKKRWGVRFPHLVENIAASGPDVIAVQEVEKSQEKDLNEYLVGYDSVMLYRDKSIVGEAVGIYYRSDRFEKHPDPALSGGFWLSDTPEKMSKGWDASAYRVCTFVTLIEKETKYTFTVFSTHLDHKGEKSVDESLKVMDEKIKKLKKISEIESFILTGDFNFDEKSSAYEKSMALWDNAKYQPEGVVRINEGRTYNGYKKKSSKSEDAIDHIFYLGELEAKTYGRLERTVNGIYPSDHFPVLVKFKK